tara:strand:- start:7 stop:285 length:279 start_codon:yes stop_codon:yes gene_type:complete
LQDDDGASTHYEGSEEYTSSSFMGKRSGVIIEEIDATYEDYDAVDENDTIRAEESASYRVQEGGGAVEGPVEPKEVNDVALVSHAYLFFFLI